MRKAHYGEVIKRNELITDEIICNKCGNKIQIVHNFGLVPHDVFEDHFHGTMHYETDRSRRMDIEDFDLCQSCYNELITSFKIPVQRY